MQEHLQRERLTTRNSTHYNTDDPTLNTTGGGKRRTNHGKTTLRSMEMGSKAKEWKLNGRLALSNRNVIVCTNKRKTDTDIVETDTDRKIRATYKGTENTLPGNKANKNFGKSIKNCSEIVREAIKRDNSELA